MRKKLEVLNTRVASEKKSTMEPKSSNFKISMQFDQLNRMKAIFNSLPPNFAMKEFYRVRITHSVSPEEFYVVKWQSIEDLWRLHCKLFDRYSGKIHATIAAPEKGVICCVKLAGAWFRAIINEIGKEATCRVRLIDSGGITWTKWSNLCVLEENLAELPAYSAQCKLANVKATATQTEWFNAFCANSDDVYVLINTMSSDGSCDVLLYSSDGSSEYQCINRTIRMAAENSIRNNSNGSESQAALSASSNRSRPRLIDILHMQSLELFFIELQADKAGIQRLLNDVQRYACSLDENAIGNLDWKMGDDCLVQVQRPNKSPHFWYRSQIVGVSRNRYEVYLRDEGVTVTVSDRLCIRPIEEGMCNVRNRAIRCRLSGIQPIERLDNDDVVQKFMEIANQFDRLAISVHEKPHDRILPILLWGGKMQYENLMLRFEWCNINRLLVDRRLAEPSEKFELTSITMNDEANSEARIAVEVENEFENIQFVGDEIGQNIDFGIMPAIGHEEYDLNDEIQTVDVWLPSDKIFKPKYVAMVTYVSTKCVLYVLDAYRQTVAETMQKKINEHVQQQKTSQVHSTDWIKEVGQACFARFQDRNYYRASIRRICRENDYCLVRFIDYGNVEICKMKNIYPAVMFGDVPTLTQTYVFANVRPAYDNAVSDEWGRYRWPKKVLDYCYANLVDHRCIIHVIDDFSGGINTCELFKGDHDIEFGAKLVRNDMAGYIDSLIK